jgi:hypothetical protein
LSLVRILARTHDFYIIEGLQLLEQMTAADLNRANYCRIFLGVYLASDVVTPDGTHLLPGLFKGSLT